MNIKMKQSDFGVIKRIKLEPVQIKLATTISCFQPAFSPVITLCDIFLIPMLRRSMKNDIGEIKYRIALGTERHSQKNGKSVGKSDLYRK